EDRQRQITKEEEERASAEEFERQESELLSRIGAPQQGGQAISIMDAVPLDEPQGDQGRVEAPASQAAISMVDIGASQNPDQAAASSMMQDRLMRNVEAARVAQDQASVAPPPQARETQVAEAAPKEQPQQAPARPGISLFASPAFASTMPEGGPQAPRAEPGQATVDAVQGRGQGYSDYQEATRGIRSDAPRRGTMEDMVAQERAANAPRPDRPAASPEAQARATQTRDKAMSILPAGDPVTAVMDRLNRSGMGIASTAADVAGGALSAVGAMDAGARMYDRGSSMKDAQRYLEAQDRASTQPAPTSRAPAAQPVAQPNARNQGQGPTRAAAQALQISGARPVAEAPSIRSAGGEAIQNAIADATRSEGVSIAEAARGETTPAENRRIAEQAGRGIAESWNLQAAAELEQLYVRSGNFEKAKMVQEWVKDKKVQAGIEKWGEAMVYMQLGDKESLLGAITDLYNMKGYYDDGLSVVKSKTKWNENDDGEIVGMTVTFKDNATGRQFTQSIQGAQGMIGTAIIGAMAPDTVVERMMSEVEKERAAQSGNRPEQISAQDRAEAIASLAKEMAGVEGVTPEILRAAEAEYDRLIGGQRAADVPVYAP
ncbi:MAG: hypothetical protein JXQ79_10240, partial [Rhodobacteraceae bacterium]|nr:hypothetical protein [Paracoccaceae bacterium]